jgi:sugar-specific transcriptional regulator TrmB
MQPIKKRDYSLLRKLGLSKQAVACYQSLVNNGGGKVSELSQRLNLPRTGLYKVLDKLNEQGFVSKIRVDGASTSYSAWPINRAMEQYIKYQKRAVAPLLGGYENFRPKPPFQPGDERAESPATTGHTY